MDNAKVFSEKVIEEVDWEMTLDAEHTWTEMKTCMIWIVKEILESSVSFLVKMMQYSGIRKSRQWSKKIIKLLSCIRQMQE